MRPIWLPFPQQCLLSILGMLDFGLFEGWAKMVGGEGSVKGGLSLQVGLPKFFGLLFCFVVQQDYVQATCKFGCAYLHSKGMRSRGLDQGRRKPSFISAAACADPTHDSLPFLTDDVPPYFKTEPVRSQLHLEGNRLVLTCMAEGSWPLEFKWIHNETELTRFSLEYRWASQNPLLLCVS